MKRILLFFITIFSASLFAQLSFDYESSGQILPNSEGVSQIDLPVTFDASGIDYTMGDFGGNVSTLIVDPTDASNSVMQVVKTQGAETWAGTTIGTATGFANPILFTSDETKMSVRVWSPLADLPIRLKVENADSANHSCETEANTIVANGLQTLVFDFDQQAPGTEPLSTGLSNGWVFNKASIFFNFGAAGDTEMTFYFDDVELGGIIGISDIAAQLNIYPNPTNTHWQITSHEVIEEVVLVDVLGKVVARYPVQTNTVSINAMSFDSGMYIANIRTASGSFTEVLLRR